MDNLLRQYFLRGHRYKIIAAYLEKDHQVSLSVRTIKRILHSIGLKRNGISKPLTDQTFREAVDLVQTETERRAGYRRTWHILNRQRGIRATQEQVRLYLLQSNPIAVQSRVQRLLIRRRYNSLGPNHVWHFDGYDKLKPYGFAISGCADGFSRKIIWLSCSVTNNNPAVILHYYLTAVNENRGCPVILRSDCGTETGLVAAAQCTLRNNNRSHVFGPSYRNQRIESWWSKLRQGWTQIWMNIFDDLVTFGAYDPSNLIHQGVVEFCFMRIIQEELQEFTEWWNHHRIRRTHTSGCPGGIPVELFELPEVHGATNKLRPVNLDELNVLITQATQPPQFSDPQLCDLCHELCQVNGWNRPTSRPEALQLCIKMLIKISPVLN